MSDCRSCVHSFPVVSDRLGRVVALDCTPPVIIGEPIEPGRGRNCPYYEREPGSDDYIK